MDCAWTAGILHGRFLARKRAAWGPTPGHRSEYDLRVGSVVTDNMKAKVYLETTIVSYLTAEPTRDVVQAAHQQLTREWWDCRGRFDLFVSQSVITEAGGGNPEAARRRLAALEGIPNLAVTAEAADLAAQFVRAQAMPERAAVDALRDSGRQRHGLRANVELHAHRECGDS